MASPRLFDLGADLYAAYTDNPPWRASCAALAGHLPAVVGRVLDLGCGPGTTIAALAAVAPGTQWIGGDLAGRMLRLAQRRLHQAGVAAQLTRLDALALPFATGSVDGIVGHSFLYLVPDERQALLEAYRVLRSGGRVAFMEPAVGYVSPAAIWHVSHDPRFLCSIPPWRAMSRRHRRYSLASFTVALQEAGFDDVRCTPVLGGLGIIGSGRRRDG
ncbi:MAG: class I SAM-dependent methyltransferase [Chloroflexota bacterium]